MAKKHRIHPQGTSYIREAVPQPKDVAEFVAPRTVNEGLSVKNVFGDVGDMIDPFITAAIEKQEGLRDVSDDELKMLAALGSIPVAGAVAGKVAKKLNKLVPNPKGGFLNVLPIKNEQGKNYLTKATSPEELKILNDGVDIAKEKKIISAEDAEKLKNNFNSTYNHDVNKQKLIDNGLINPDSRNKSALKQLSKDDIKNKSFDDYDKAKELGEKYKVKIKDKGTSLEGDEYFTLYSDNTPMLYSEDLTDANIGRHVLSDYDDKLENVNKEARELLPWGNNQIKQIFGKGQNKSYNTYKAVIEPEMFKDLMILNNNEASRNSINAGKALSDNLENKITPLDFYKIILGL